MKLNILQRVHKTNISHTHHHEQNLPPFIENILLIFKYSFYQTIASFYENI